ncbi:MAG: TonB-dependent receptor family protein [Gammaproteobacteria bacterium]
MPTSLRALRALVSLTALIPFGVAQTALAQTGPAQVELEEITIIGDRTDVASTTGAATVIDAAALDTFAYTDIQSIVRQVPGVSVQLEDGFGLRPNLSIRGTASERSGRITLLEDNVLIAPAPYSAPSAYYFPTAGRMHQVEVLKGSAAVRQGPYTVGGAMNFVSTPISAERTTRLNLEGGQFGTTRAHGVYSDSTEQLGWLLEAHLWNSDGFQDIDGGGDTGLDKDDITAKFRFNSKAGASIYQQLDVKLQYAKENSDQSYLGLTDSDFAATPLRRYGVSALDNIETEHDQVIVRYLADFKNGLALTATAYSNNHERDWFKTEGLDFDGSADAQAFSRTSWFSVVQAANSGSDSGGATSAQLQAILNGGDTAEGAVQLRSNAREYYSRGIQLGLDYNFTTGSATHELEVGLRVHEDEEDRLQRNSTYTQTDGELVLADLGLLGNAGNRIQSAEALSMHIYDRIEWKDWVFTPGLRYEDIDQSRVRYEIRDGQTDDPSSRAADNVRDQRENSTHVLIPGVGALYALSDAVSVYGGVHKGFTAPSNAPDVDEEESINYEFGLRANYAGWQIDTAAFFTDYDNLLGECTSASGNDCEVGDAFNGDAASIFGIELAMQYNLSRSANYALPLSLSYTYLDGEFDSDIADTAFFGDVSSGDPLPYIPEHQFLLSMGVERGAWSAYLNTNFVDETCVRASCGAFERTDDFLIVDLAAHYQFNDNVNLYTRIDNLTGEEAIVARQPYGARPNRDRTVSLGVRIDL